MNIFSFNDFILGVSDPEVIKTLKDYDQHLEESNPVLDIFRWGCFTIMKWLVNFVDWMSNITHDALTLFGLLENTEVIDMIKDLEPVIMALFAGTLLYLGIKMMLGTRVKTHEKFVTLIVAIIFLVSLSSSTDRAIDITEKATEDIDNYTSEDSKSKIGTNILKNSVIDLKYMDKKMNWKKPNNDDKDGSYNNLTNKSVNYIDINEKIGQGKADTDLGKEVTKNKIVFDENGKEKLEKLDDGFWGLGATEYYRYSLSFFKGSLGLICTALGYFFAGFAIASIILETIIGLFVAVFGASTLQGDKLKSTIVDMLNGLVAIVFVFICIFVFEQLMGFILNKNMGIYTVGMIAGVKFMIDGPKIVERKFGFDAGMKAPLRTLIATYTATKLATQGAKAGGQAVGAGAKKFGGAVQSDAKKFGGALKSDANNFKNAFSSNKSENSNQNSTNPQSQLNNTNDNNFKENNDNQNTQQNEKNLGEQSKENAENQGYLDNGNTNSLESEKAFSEANNRASGGSQHDQLWANKPEGSIFGRNTTQNNTQSFNDNKSKEASFNNRVGNDMTNQGTNNNYASNQQNDSSNTSFNTQSTANDTSAPTNLQAGGYNTPKPTSNTSVNNQNKPQTPLNNQTNRYNSPKGINGFSQKTSQPSNISKTHQPTKNHLGFAPKTQPARQAKEVKTHNISKNRPRNFKRPAQNNQTQNRIKPKR